MQRLVAVFASIALIACFAAADSSGLIQHKDVLDLDDGGNLCLLQREQSNLHSEGKAAAAGALQAQAPAQAQAQTQTQAPSKNEVAAGGPAAGSQQQQQSPREQPPPREHQHGELHAGVSDGAALDYAAQAHPAFAGVQVAKGATFKDEVAGEPKSRNKIILMVIDLCPVCWMLGIDRLYLGSFGLGIAKFAVCVATCGIGGLIWGLVDFLTVVVNALGKKEAINSVGMHATFGADQLHMAWVLAIVDLLMVPATIGVARFVWWWRKQQRMERLKEAAMKSPHYGVAAHQVKGG